MLRFGKVVPGSIKRGVIKGTNIENGSRYIDILDCEAVLPNRTSLGRFEVRLLFADNNRTPCIYCHITGHPSYRCKNKPSIMNQRRCYNCSAIGHVANACPNEAHCSYCNIKDTPDETVNSTNRKQKKRNWAAMVLKYSREDKTLQITFTLTKVTKNPSYQTTKIVKKRQCVFSLEHLIVIGSDISTMH
ncbi:CNBP [Mytilus coruscus]|uniref:CNBP n=1 Tax=Mytilus coruscus TaxID=42192 RepID=A0A6J8EWP5_MYTCO|nr:CNBP [Mytilus coruscus]